MHIHLSTALFALALLVTSASAQVMETIQTGDTCSFFGEDIPESVVTFSSDSEAMDVITRIVDASGLVQNFQIRAAGVPNAAAVIREETRYILYNQHFMRDTRRSTNSDWAPISIMAHEVGHHLNGHTLDNLGSRPAIELEADYYSGFILQRLGATLDEARVAMLTLGSDAGSDTHPAKHDRLAAIDNGWIRACQSNPACTDQVSDNGGGITPGSQTTSRMPPTNPQPAAGSEPNSCPWAFDGECDEPHLCPNGTDTADCSGSGAPPAGPNSCQWAFDGECDEPDICPSGTDTADCRGGTVKIGPNSCQWAFDGECDEPDLCSRGTDTADCQVATRLPARQGNVAGFPAGQPMQDCGCWGGDPMGTAPEPLCQSGYVQIAICEGKCEGGGSPYGYLCQ